MKSKNLYWACGKEWEKYEFADCNDMFGSESIRKAIIQARKEDRDVTEDISSNKRDNVFRIWVQKKVPIVSIIFAHRNSKKYALTETDLVSLGNKILDKEVVFWKFLREVTYE